MGNVIADADAASPGGTLVKYPPIGAISLSASWVTGPVDPAGRNQWPLGDSTLIFHNTLEDVAEAEPDGSGVPRVGIGVDLNSGTLPPPASTISWRTTLYANRCSHVDVPVRDQGVGSVRYCPTGASSSCECSGVPSVDISVSARASRPATRPGATVTYTATVINHDPSATASQVALLVQPSAGALICGDSFVASQGSCDASVNACALGSLAPGQRVTVSLNASLATAGSWPVSFSVTHAEPDPDPANNSAVVTEVAQ